MKNSKWRMLKTFRPTKNELLPFHVLHSSFFSSYIQPLIRITCSSFVFLTIAILIFNIVRKYLEKKTFRRIVSSIKTKVYAKYLYAYCWYVENIDDRKGQISFLVRSTSDYFLWENKNTWLIKIEVRGARPHDRRALHAACLIPRACGSEKSFEESQNNDVLLTMSRSSTDDRRLRNSRVFFLLFDGVCSTTMMHRHPSPSIRNMKVAHTRFDSRQQDGRIVWRRVSIFFFLLFFLSLFTRPNTHRSRPMLSQRRYGTWIKIQRAHR